MSKKEIIYKRACMDEFGQYGGPLVVVRTPIESGYKVTTYDYDKNNTEHKLAYMEFKLQSLDEKVNAYTNKIDNKHGEPVKYIESEDFLVHFVVISVLYVGTLTMLIKQLLEN